MHFMAGEGEVIDGCLRKVNDNFADGLRGIHMKADILLLGHLGNVVNGKEHACLMVGPNQRQKADFRGKGFFQRFDVELTFFINRHIDNPRALCFKVP